MTKARFNAITTCAFVVALSAGAAALIAALWGSDVATKVALSALVVGVFTFAGLLFLATITKFED